MSDEEDCDNDSKTYLRVDRRSPVEVRDGYHVACIGQHEIWDGADLALIFDTLRGLTKTEGHNAIGVDLSHVKAIPGGFFGMLFNHAAKGVSVRVYSPQAEVRQFLWFREYFRSSDGVVFQMVIPEQTELARNEPKPQATSRKNYTHRRRSKR